MILNERNLRIFARSVLFQNKEVINEISFAPEVPDSLSNSNKKIFNGYESRILDKHGPMIDVHGHISKEEEEQRHVSKSRGPCWGSYRGYYSFLHSELLSKCLEEGQKFRKEKPKAFLCSFT